MALLGQPLPEFGADTPAPADDHVHALDDLLSRPEQYATGPAGRPAPLAYWEP